MQVSDLAIAKQGKHFIVKNVHTGKDLSIKYNDEAHALRFAKHITKFKRDWRVLEVKKLYNDSPVPDVKMEATVEPPQEPVEPEEKIPWIATYYCTKCNANHMKTSEVGRRHLKHRKGG